MDAQIVRFFDLLVQGREVYFRFVKGEIAKGASGHYNEEILRIIEQFNAQGFECYYIANSGGYQQQRITHINAVFADLDCGKDTSERYFPIPIVEEFKQVKFAELSKLALPPSAIIETRNGYQALWFLYEGATPEDFEECEKRILSHLKADKQVKSISNSLRVAGTQWCKYEDEKFDCRLVELKDFRYDIKEIIAAFPDIEVTKKKNDRGNGLNKGTNNIKKCSKLLSIDGTKALKHTKPGSGESPPALIRQRNIEAMRSVVNAQPYTAETHNDVYDYLKLQDLRIFLGVGSGSFSCLFQEDKKPSAGIFQMDSDHFYYKCHSDNCGFQGTIFDVTKKIMKTENTGYALRFLRAVYQISYEESSWQEEQKRILEENIRIVTSESFCDAYPRLYQRVASYLKLLCVMHEIGSQNIYTERFTDSSGLPVFFVSIRELARRSQKDIRRTSTILDILVYMGFINKLSESEIPPFLLREARHHAAKRKQRYLISYYSIPQYDEVRLALIDRRVSEFKERGLTVKTFGWESLLRILGKEEANRVYPQKSNDEPTKFSDELRNLVTVTVMRLIDSKGWTRRHGIVEAINWNRSDETKIRETKILRYFPEIFDAYDLCEEYLTKGIKEVFNIECKGYPKIIFPCHPKGGEM